MKKKVLIGVCIAIVILVGVVIGITLFSKGKDSKEVSKENGTETVLKNPTTEEKKEEEPKKDSEVDVVKLSSNSRPFAVVVNNTAVAVKVQEGLNKAYMVYEIPTEGNTSRLLALYKDIEEDLVIGTIRSARHNFIDFALESDAIFCCFGWSHYAEDDLKAGSINYLQGLFGEPFYRKNPENLDSEHTAYTSMNKLKNAIKTKGFRTTSNEDTVLKYDPEDIDLSEVSNVKTANKVKIPYGDAPQISSFVYDEKEKMYTRYENSVKCVDHNTKEAVTTKNIIVQKIDYKKCDDGYYWDLKTVGSGDGYYITNGYAVKINWKKTSRKAQTVYTYAQGTIIDGKDVSGQEITVSDGRTWIEVQTNEQTLTIE